MFPTAEGWTTSRHETQPSGFEAISFQRGSEIVISYAGTYDKDLGGDQLANAGMATGVGSAQLLQAVEYYLQVKAANPGATITLTGHSLGGGLAALVGVFFGETAQTFDQAPFAKTAWFKAPETMAYLVGQIDPGGNRLYSDAELTPLASYIEQKEAFGADTTFIPNVALISNINVQGEFLSSAPWTVYDRIGTTTDTIANSAPGVSGFDLHAQALLTAYLQSDLTAPSGQALNEVTATLPQLLGMIFDGKLYSFRADDASNRNFLDHLVRHEAGGIGGIPAGGDAMLTHFAADLNKLGTNIAGLNAAAQAAIIAQGIEWYYWQGTDYAGQEFFTQTGELLQYTTAHGAGLTGAQNKALSYVKLWLDGYLGSVQSNTLLVTTPNYATFEQWNVSAGTTGISATALDANRSQIFIGQDGADSFTGGSKNDLLFGGAGNDSYNFTSSFGKDTILDTDGLGLVQIDGQAMGTAKGIGERGAWAFDLGAGVYAGLAVYDDARSSTGKRLVITKGTDTSNTITINNFDLTAAQGSQGYLGIKLDNTARLVINASGGSNVWSDLNFDPGSLAGQQSNIVEGTGKTFTLYLNQAAKAGETLTLALSGLADKFKAILGDSVVDANGAVITLAEGQTQVSFALVQEGEVTADASLQLSASYAGIDQSATSNAWGVTLSDAGDPDNTYNGDYLVSTETNYAAPITRINMDGQSVEVVATNALYYVRDGQGNLVAGSTGPTYRNIYDAEGHVIGVEEIPSDDVTVNNNTIYGSAGKDTINGLSGDDALSGGAGNDTIDGGIGSDMIGGGAGSDRILGGDGNDYISSSADIAAGRQQYGANDTWDRWGLPGGKTAIDQGGMWGVYLDTEASGGTVTIWSGITETLTNTAGTEGDVIDAGAGDDWVMGSWAGDRIQGGDGKDRLDGLAGDDVMEGGAGDDNINADGITKAGYLNSVDAAHQGNDFADGGDDNDHVNGGGGNDQLFGGAGNDVIIGDSSGKTDGEFYVSLDAHGQDYLDGEDGDDYLEGGGKDDTLYGGGAQDNMWGDTSASNVVTSADNALMWGNDYLDGEDGDDQLVGGGKDDTLYGGIGDDLLWGDESNAALAGEFNGNDYLDGEDGVDQLVGGGKDDILYGGAGDDSLFGDDDLDKVAAEFQGADYLDGEDGNDYLMGGGGDDILIGGDGNDVLNGGTGADYMEGGAGDDSYVVDDEGDMIVEADSVAAPAGSPAPLGFSTFALMGATAPSIDNVQSSITYALGANLDNLTLTGTAAINGGGNSLDNLLTGNSGANTLEGGAGNDQLVGGAGADTLIGGSGDDIYDVDNVVDTLVEAEGEGDDFVRSAVSFTLEQNLERLQATGTAAIALTGNTLDNGLFGNSGDNILTGGAGNDYLAGDAGNDVYVFNRGDGHDTIENTDFLRDTAHPELLGATDTLRFGAGIADTDVIGLRSGDSMFLKIKGTTDQVGVANYYGEDVIVDTTISDHKIDRVEFANSVVWDQAMIQTMVNRAANNRAPTVAAGLGILHARADSLFTYTVPVGTITDPDAWDSVNYSVKMQDGSAVPAWLGFDAATRTFSGTPDTASIGNLQFVLWGTDDYGAAAGTFVTLTVAQPNGAPVLSAPLLDQSVIQGAAFSYTMPANAFADPDGDALTYSATLADGGALPAWLVFNAQTRSFTGTPSVVGTTSVRVTASDGSILTTADVFDIAVLSSDIVGTPGNDVLNGGAGNDIVFGLAGADVIHGGDGNDQIDGGTGTNQIYGDAGDDILDGRQGYNDTLYGGNGNDTLFGGLYSTLFGDAGNDTLSGGDVMYGGLGLDTYKVTYAPNYYGTYSSYIYGEAGGDTVLVGGGFNPNDIEVRRDRATDNFVLTNRLSGGVVTLVSQVTAAGTSAAIAEVRFESAPGVVWTAADLKQMAMTGDDRNNRIWGYANATNTVIGAGGEDDLYGGNLSDTIDGGTGSDYLEGRLGNDTYLFGLDSGADRVVDIAANGGNIIQLQPGVTLSNLRLLRTGQTGGNSMAANDSLVLLIESTGARLWIDQFFQPNNQGTVSEIRFADGSGTVWTYADIVARAGTSLSGSQNTMTGTAGDDVFAVDNASDVIVESTGGGIDTVQSSVSYTLPGEVENLELIGVLAVNGTGNAGNNVLRGNDGNNTLRGSDSVNQFFGGNGGIDQYFGGRGDDIYIDFVDQNVNANYGSYANALAIFELPNEGIDTIVTNAYSMSMPDNVERLVVNRLVYSWSYPGVTYQYIGNAQDNVIDLSGSQVDSLYSTKIRIDGGAGNDTMIGGQQRYTTYVVDSVGDVVIESRRLGGEVESSISYSLGNNLINLKLTGTAAIDGTGNQLDNILDGRVNSLANVLTGLAGDDTYYLGVGDTLVETAGGGNDTVVITTSTGITLSTLHLNDWANIESLKLENDVGNIDIIGDTGNNLLMGSLGVNTIDGLDGDDTIVNIYTTLPAYEGASYSGTYATNSSDHLNGGNGNDKIYSSGGYDFIDGGAGNDRIYLDSVRYATVNGGTGDDVIVEPSGLFSVQLSVGGGNDLVSTSNYSGRTAADWASQRDTRSSIDLATGTDANNLRFNQSGDSLVVSLTGSGDSVTITKFFVSDASSAIQSRIDSVRLPDGTVLTRDAIAAGLGRIDLQIATAGNDLLIASTTNHALSSGDGDDQLIGQGAGDQLDGGAGSDHLYGGDGADQLTGGAGNDTLVGGHGADNYMFALGWGQDVVDEMQSIERPASSYIVPWIVDDGTSDAIVFDGSIASSDINTSMDGLNLLLSHKTTGDSITVLNYFDAPNALTGQVELIRFADNTVWDRNTVDQFVKTITGTSDDDVLYGRPNIGSDMFGLAGNDSLYGQGWEDKLYGGEGNDYLDGSYGNDFLDGGAGDDQMFGGYDDDSYIVDSAGDVVTEFVGDGTDLVLSGVTYTLDANVENLTLTGTAAIDGTGNSLSNVLSGNNANNVLNGGAGADTMTGAVGNDTYVVDNAADTVIEYLDEGTDLVQSGVTYTLSSNIENLTLTGTGSFRATGNSLDNVLTGNSAANVLTGGAGNDTYVVGTGDSTVELAGDGIDTVQSAVTWTLGTEVENLTLTGTSAINGTGNTSNNVLTGNSAANTLNGGTGADTLLGGLGNDIYVVDNVADVVTENLNEGTDLVQSSVSYTLSDNVENLTLTGTTAINATGNALNNTLTGNAGVNILDGGAGADTMVGGAGNDTYYVDNAADITTEAASAGTDTVVSSINWTLATNVENLTLSGTANINATGNTVANVLTGNAGDNVLSGGAGADTMVGGLGNDTYVVDVATDVVTESLNAGTDLVNSNVTYTLSANVENLTLTGSTAINGTGNTLDNVLTGNTGANVLTGGTGNDTYIVSTGDTTIEVASAGTDTVQSAIAWTLATNVENLTLTGTSAVNGTGNTLDNVLLGNTGINTLTGNAGNDTLDGKAGADILVGGVGNDTYWLGRGYGADSITENDATVGNLDIARFDATIATDQLWFRQVSNNLEVSIIGTSDKFSLSNWYLGSQYHVEQFKTSDGKTLLDSQVQNLVSAMAAFSPPAAGQTTLPANYAATLSPVIVANWQ
ncbi:calcium-binding protein [Rhodoferax sp.]|uniref:calcium-binding protein n=1 Tax=Rhodoferax sp. TaxID=50421 RepID=UPI00271C14B0|nr:calcium-binding protein [Rhodoferax sp.]MDO9198669.1 calcium-binding protein [Rhodoferax sp.]